MFLLSLAFPLFVLSQNLLMNGGFEDENICAEYQKNCAPEGWISTSLYADYYFDDAPNAAEGQHFIGLVLSNAGRLNGRNFIRSRLLCGLRKGSQYRLDFSIRSLHNVFDSIGVYFSANDFLYQKEKIRGSKPQLYLGGNGLQASKAWQKVSLVYTAGGQENFISIGDFKTRHHQLPGRPDLGRDHYFFLDSISLTPLSPNEHPCDERASRQEEEYGFNVRHNQLDRLMYVYTKNPPRVEPAPKTIVQRVDTIVIPDVLFATNSYALGQKAKEILGELSDKTRSFRVDSVVVEGHTDNQGSAALNHELSRNRAASVIDFLRPSFSSPLMAKSFASNKPVADNRTPEGRRKNRRVEIYLYIRE